MKRILLGIICLHTSFSLTSQTITTKATPSLKFLYALKDPIGAISNTDKLVFSSLIIGNIQPKIKIIKNRSGLYVLIDGTGQVFKATRLDEGIISFKRIDSTTFFGYNFLSIKYSYNDTLYSFGGYGFWQMNGQLIHFNPGAEWSIDRINKVFKTTNFLYNYLPDDGKIYYVEQPREEESTFEKREKYLTVEFDLKKKENKLLGKINPVIDLGLSDFTIDLPSLKGVLSYTNRDFYLYNFKENKVYKLINKKIKEGLLRNSGDQIQTTFYLDGKIYFSYIKDTNLHVLNINLQDFKEEPYLLYIQNKNWPIIRISYIIISILLISLLIITRYLIKKKEITKKNVELTYSNDLNTNEFNSIEITLINKLIEQSNKHSHLTVDELNSILGIKKKTIEIQKRVRTEAINRINHKFNVNFNLETTFIERTRSVEDRRYFNYVINKENASIYQKR